MASPSSSSSVPGGVQLGRIFGIPLVVHGSWLISLGVLSVVANSAIVPSVAPTAAPAIQLALSVAFGLIIAACIVLHELAHCVVARAYGLPVRRITLFAFGGVSQIEREAPGPAAEFHIAVAGPLSSLIIASVLALISRLLAPHTVSLHGAWGGVAYVNIVLAIFNLLPAFPMDGGRMLRSGLWGAVRNRARATRWAVFVGRALAGLMIAFGAVSVGLSTLRHGEDAFGSVWTILIGFFIYQSAGSAGAAEGADQPNTTTTGLQPPAMRKPR
jgi:Zn-dependent protease